MIRSPSVGYNFTVIREFCIHNFKAFREADLDFAPLTLLVGANSTGKSTILQALLLLKQTVDYGDPGVPLRFEGPLINLGSFKETIHREQNYSPKRIGFRLVLTGEHPKEYAEGDDGAIISEVQSTDYDLRFEVDIIPRAGLRVPPGSFSAKIVEGPYSEDYKLKHKSPSLQGLRPRFFWFWPSNPSDKRYGWLFQVANVLMGIFKRIFYLAPLRDYPERDKIYSSQRPAWMGIRGEELPAFLHSRHEIIASINKWLRENKFPSKEALFSIETVLRQEKTRLSLLVKEGGRKYNWADVGFGLSQFLPVAAAVFAVPDDSLLLVEQPEIHLNPRMEVLLGQLLVDVAREGKKIILVETHSEHLIMRVRRLVAEGYISPDKVKIYHTERDWKVGNSTIREIKWRDDLPGAIEGWPEGFMDESITEAFGISRAQRRNRSKET